MTLSYFSCEIANLCKVSTFHFISFRRYGRLVTEWRHRIKILNFRWHQSIEHVEISKNAKFQLFLSFPSEVMRCRPFSIVLWGRLVTEWRHRVKILNFRWHQSIEHVEISQNAKFQLFLSFPSEVMRCWPFLLFYGAPGHWMTSYGQNFKFSMTPVHRACRN